MCSNTDDRSRTSIAYLYDRPRPRRLASLLNLHLRIHAPCLAARGAGTSAPSQAALALAAATVMSTAGACHDWGAAQSDAAVAARSVETLEARSYFAGLA